MLLRPMNQYYTPKPRTIKPMNSNQIINGSYLSYERLSAKIPQIVSAGILYRKWIRFSATSKELVYRILEPKICENQIMCRVWTYSIHTENSTRRTRETRMSPYEKYSKTFIGIPLLAVMWHTKKPAPGSTIIGM